MTLLLKKCVIEGSMFRAVSFISCPTLIKRFEHKERPTKTVTSGFLKKLRDLGDSVFHAPTDAHSKVLTASEATYELQFDYVKPECMPEYLEEVPKMNSLLHNLESYSSRLVGSWTTIYGDVDLAIHLWVHPKGYEDASAAKIFWMTNKSCMQFQSRKSAWLRRRENQLLHEFQFWGEPKPRDASHIYELRSYSLKPGTMIEWGNNWAKALHIRRKDAVGGFFTQIGPLYEVHHLWAYRDLVHRKSSRENMWQHPGWGDCVTNTVPLVREMQTRVLTPMVNSPMQ